MPLELHLNLRDSHAACTLCCLLAATIKDSLPSIRDRLRSPDRAYQLNFLIFDCVQELDHHYTRTSPRDLEPFQIETLGQEVFEGISGAHRLNSDPAWQPVEEFLNSAGLRRFQERLQYCIDDKNDLRPSSYLNEAFERARDLLARLLSDLSKEEPVQLDIDHKVSAISVIDASEGESHVVSYSPPTLEVRTHKAGRDVLTHFALPLYFFHEIFSHLLPQADLSSKCADGWLMVAAHRAWKRLIPRDLLVQLEVAALLRNVAEDGYPGNRIKISPYFQAGDVFAEHFPRIFWCISMEMLAANDRKTIDKVLVYLKAFLVDPATSDNLDVWFVQLREIVERPWRGLEEFARALRDGIRNVESRLNIQGLD